MTTLDATLLEPEERLGSGDGDTYRELLIDEAVVIVPGQALTKETSAAAMDASPGWDDFAMEARESSRSTRMPPCSPTGSEAAARRARTRRS